MIKVVFSLFDEDNNGYLDYEELKFALKALGFLVKKAEVLKMLETYDRKDKKLICFEDFKTIAIDKIMRCHPIEEMKYAFKLMCGDYQQGIGVKELKRIVDLTGLEINSNDIESMINEFDTDQDNILNEEEFLKIMLIED
ncbi:Calmodulin [Gryllus bimaculatus]|nr:Calmodulin [Gryllus bimaculatus]